MRPLGLVRWSVKTARRCCVAISPLLLFAVVGCTDMDMSGRQFAVVSVPLEDGTVLYFKKETWGLNGERTVISRRPDWPEPTGDGDYEYCCSTSPLPVFRAQGSELHLYAQGREWRRRNVGPGPVVFEETSVSEFNALSCGKGPHAVRVIDFWDWPLEPRVSKPVSIEQVEKRRGPVRLSTRCI